MSFISNQFRLGFENKYFTLFSEPSAKCRILKILLCYLIHNLYRLISFVALKYQKLKT
jgi:hypothetical protein